MFRELLLLVLFANWAFAQDQESIQLPLHTLGYVIRRAFLPRTGPVNKELAQRAEICENTAGYKCSGCDKLMYCIGTEQPLLTRPCSSINPNLPYCTTDKCTAQPDPSLPNCVQQSDTFLCTDEGYFPDPTDCTVYRICRGLMGPATLYQCPSGYFYQSQTRNCRRRFFASECKTVNCTSTKNDFVAYPGDSAYYAFCKEDLTTGQKQTIMFKCQDDVNFQFNAKTKGCDFVCRQEGRVIDSVNCRNYYECYRSGLSWTYKYSECPTGFVFNNNSKLCQTGTACL